MAGTVRGPRRRPAGDVVERAYERDQLPDWELVFELSRRAMSAEASNLGEAAIPVGWRG